MKSVLFCLAFAIFAVPAFAAPLKIVADISPLAALAGQIADRGAEVKALIPAGASSHDFALRPSDVRALRDADLILWSGEDSTPALAKLLGAAPLSARVLDLSTLPGVTRLQLRGKDPDKDHQPDHGKDDQGHENGHEDGHGQGNGHGHGQFDPHLWLSPDNGSLWAGAIAETLDPEGKDKALAARLTEVKDEIATLQDRARILFANPPLRPYIQYHDAFAYFETGFGLEPLGIATSDDEESASLGIIAKLRSRVADQQSLCVMISHESQTSAANALMVAPDSRLINAPVTGAGSYTALLTTLLGAFERCLYTP